MKIELITMWYNEEFLAPFFFNHYSWVDKIHVLLTPFPNDRTEAIAKRYPNVEIEYFRFPDDKIDDVLKVDKFNEKYRSLTEADYVILVDSDEFIFCDRLNQPVRDHISATMKDIYFVNFWQVYKHEQDLPLDPRIPVFDQRRHGDANMLAPFNILYVKPVVLKGRMDIVWAPGNHELMYKGKSLFWGTRNTDDFSAMNVSMTKGEMLQGAHWRLVDLDETITRRINNRKNRISRNNLSKGMGYQNFKITEEEIIREYNDHKNDPVVIRDGGIPCWPPLNGGAIQEGNGKAPMKASEAVNRNNPLRQGKQSSYYGFARPEVVAAILKYKLPTGKVLEIGCAGGATGRNLKESLPVQSYVGIEVSKEAADIAKNHLDRVIIADIEKTDLAAEHGLKLEEFDLLLALDVLEHLYDPWSVLAELSCYVKPGGYVVASLPNIQNITIVQDLIKGNWQYQDAGILDATHLRFFTLETSKTMFSGAGLAVKNVEFVINPPLDMDKVKESGNNYRQGNLEITNLTKSEFLQLFAYQYILIAQKTLSSGTLNVPFVKTAASDMNPRITSGHSGRSIENLTSIIILTFNQLKHTRLCLQSIEKYTPQPHELILVDNGSNDGTLDYLRKYANDHNNVRVISNKENLGFAAGNNQGLAVANGNFVLMINNDTVVTEGWLARMLSVFERYPEVGIVGPVSNNISGPQQVKEASYRSLEDMPSFAEQWSAEHSGESIEYQRVVGFCLLARREVIDRIGGLDERFGSGNFEDDDFCLRAAAAGYKARIAQDAFIHHTGSQTFKGAGINYQQSLLRNWEIFKKKWKLPQDLPYGTSYSFNLDRQNLSQYYIPLQGKTDILLEDGVKEIPSLLHPEFVKGLTSIIIPVQSIHLNECVVSLKKCTKEPYEIIFLDHGAAPKVKKQLVKALKENSGCKVINVGRKANFAQSLNEGINQSTGEYVVLLFDDVVVGEGWLSDMLGFLNRGKNIGIAGAMADDASGLQRAEGVDFKSLEERTSFRERNMHRRIFTRNLDGFCMLFRRELLIRIGLLDEVFGQDKHMFDDFCARAVLEGYENVIAGNVFVHNRGGINGLLSSNKTLFDEKWVEIDMNTPWGRKVAAYNLIVKADTLYQQGQLDKAIATFVEAIKYGPGERAVYYGFAEMLLDAKLYQDALDAVNSLPAPEGGDDIKRLEIIVYCTEGLTNGPEEVETLADRILAIDKDNAAAFNLKGMIAYKQGDKNLAEDLFGKAIASDPGYGEPFTNLGVMKWAADQKEEALDYLEKGFMLSPTLTDNASIYHTALTELGQFARAERLFKDAKELHPDNKRILFLLIDILIKQGKFDVAMYEIERAMLSMGGDEGMIAAALAIREMVGIKEIDKTSRDKGSLSLCMIVKNEERHLARCLLSAAPVADEMIVVDTGSTDRTKDIATVFGAKVFDFPWTNDFSEARNHSLSKATGDWVLVLDADEVISSLDYAAIEKIVRKKPARPVAWVMRTRNYTDSVNSKGWVANDRKYLREEAGTGWFPSDKVRLFVNDPRIRFENPVHEFVEGTLEKAGIENKFSDIPVHHYGRFDTDRIAQKGKEYFLLGKKKIEEKKGDVKAMKELAVQAVELGEFDTALELWKRVIELDERDPMAFLNIGFVYMKQKNYQEAMVVSRRAMELDPTIKEAVLNYAGCELVIGDIKKAISLLEALLRKESYYPPAMLLVAAAYYLDGQKERSAEIFEKLRRKGFNCTGFFIDEAEDFMSQGRFEQASLLLDAATNAGNISDDTAGVFNKLGQAFKLKGQTEDAIASFQKAVFIKTDFPEAHYNLGCVFNKAKRHTEAIACYREALRHKPGLAEASYNMGIAFQELGQDDEAIVCYRVALEQNPALAEPFINLGLLQQKKGENDAAMESFREAIRINPDSAEAWCNLGSLFKSGHRFEEALDCFYKAVGIDADLAEAHWNLATMLLMQGNYEQGWKEYEWRSKVRGLEGIHRKYEEPLWRGEDIAGRTILIHAEQGMGDAIQFIRYIKLVAGKGAKVIFEGPGELARLLHGVEGVDDFIPRGNPLPMFDLQCPLLSLPLLFGTTIETIPDNVPYIPVDRDLAQKWKDRIGVREGKVRVGLAWSGNPRHERDSKRSLPLGAFSCLADLRAVEFFSLQKGRAAAEVKSYIGGIEIYDFSEEIEDFADTAALIANLDLIISVDTAVAHLAGAIGKTIWTLLPFTPDWRWMSGRGDSPWYPSMKLFRQLSEGDWEGVLSRVRTELEGFHN